MFSKIAQTAAGSVRHMSTPAAKMAVSHKPPKKVAGIVGRYAGSVYTAASKAGMLEKVESEIMSVGEIMKKNEGFKTFLSNPTIGKGDKERMMGELLDETKFSFITRNLFCLMAVNGASADAAKVVDAFAEMMAASRGNVKVVITSAEPLKKAQLEAIKTGVLKMVGATGEVEVETKVDASIMGGVQVMVGDRFLDLSVASRVAELTATLDAAN